VYTNGQNYALDDEWHTDTEDILRISITFKLKNK
jgi:hypothetical protein|tara:strand:- start:192 stop:293 length:102 start_codon:yes stop_codon:yes gene_type:complete